MIIEIPSTGDQFEAQIMEDDPRAPLTVTCNRGVRVWYRLASMVQDGWRVVEASPRERAVLATYGIMVHER